MASYRGKGPEFKNPERLKKMRESLVKGHAKSPCGRCGKTVVLVPADMKFRLTNSKCGFVFCDRECYSTFRRSEMVRRCPQCNLIVGSVRAEVSAEGEVLRVTAQCKTHGLVEIKDWSKWVFFPGERNVPSEIPG